MSRAAVPSAHPTTTVETPRGRRAVLDLAPTGGEPARLPVLLVPGYTGSKEDFTPLLDPLAAAGHRVVAIDLAGQWQSDGPDDADAYRPVDLAPDLGAALDALGVGRAHLLGHSYGGLVSRAAVLADPARWASLTLLCSGPGALTGSRRDGIDLLGQLAAGMELGPLYELLLEFWASHGQLLPPEAALDFQRARFTSGRAAAVTGMARGLLDEPDRTPELRAAAARGGLPVHVVYGEHDDAWLPAEQDAMAAALGVTPVVVPGGGHSPAYEATGALLDVLEKLWA